MPRLFFVLLFAATVTAGCTTELRATRSPATVLIDAVAQKYDLCIDRRRFEIAHCVEI